MRVTTGIHVRMRTPPGLLRVGGQRVMTGIHIGVREEAAI
jgi:hypothetical protein